MKYLIKENISISVLVIFHGVGIGGTLLSDPQEFLLLTPLNLLVTLLIIFINHSEWKHAWVFAFTYMAGYGFEVLGVNTGFPFGEYEYGPILGFKLWNTPLMIGVNWLILLYACNTIAQKIGQSIITKSLFAGAFMVLIDYLIEPVAIKYNFWTWTEIEPPLENYLAWFVIAASLSLIWQWRNIKFNNTIAYAVYAVQFVFFGILNLV